MTLLSSCKSKLSTCRYAGDANGKGGIYNFVTKRGLCHGDHAKISWTQVRNCVSKPAVQKPNPDCLQTVSGA